MKKTLLITISLGILSTFCKAQTPQLININETPLSSGLTNITEFNGKLYFAADDGERGTELMEFDNSKPAGEKVTRLIDIRTGTQSSHPRDFTVINDKLYFIASTNSGGGIFEYDGINTPTETPAASTIFSQNSLVDFGGVLYYGASGGLATYNTGSSTTEFVSVVSGSVVNDLTVYNDTLYFVTASSIGSSESQIWKYDGTNAPTPIDGTVSTGDRPTNLYEFAGKLLFSYSSDGNNHELHSYNDTDASVVQIADLNQDTDIGTSPSNFIEYDGKLYFKIKNVAGLGSRIFEYDGTNAPVDVLGIGYLDILEFEVFDSKLYFTTLRTGAIDLLSYNGNTVSSVIDLGVFQNASSLEVLGNELYFASFSDEYGTELTKFNGSTATLAADVSTGDLASNPTRFTEYKGNLYFSASGSLHVFDGNTVTPYVDLFSFGNNTTEGVSVVFHDSLFFESNGKLYKTDGESTPDEIATPDATFNFNSPLVIGDTLYFNGRSNTVGEELFLYDGSAIHAVADLNPGSANFVPRNLTNVNGVLVFTSPNDEIWTYNGTGIPQKLPMSQEYADPESLIAYKNNLYFSADVDITISFNGMTATQNHSVLMRSNAGISAPVVVDQRVFGVKDLGIYRGLLVFSGYEFFDPFSPATDLINFYSGTSFTRQIAVAPSDPRSWSQFAEVNDTLYFRASDGNGHELWRYVFDEDFELVADIIPGNVSSFPLELYNYNNTLVFSADTENQGYELYQLGGNLLNGLNDFFNSDSKLGLNLYPNPASSLINTEEGQLEIFDLTGNRVLSIMSAGQVDVSSLETGIYLVNQNGKKGKLIIE